MVSIEDIKSELDEAGLKYKVEFDENEKKQIITTFWKSRNNLSIKILIFLNQNPEWINIISFIGNISNIKTKNNLSIEYSLLRLNNKIIGPKFTLDKDSNIYCNSELHLDAIKSEVLKSVMIQTVHSITLFNDNCLKK